MSREKLIFTNGCFDLLHRGHVELLKYCKSLGHVIVGLNSDASIKRLKGNYRPIIGESDRKFILESLVYVNQVIIFDEDTPQSLIYKLKPDMIVKGGDYTMDSVIGSDVCEVRIFNLIENLSTSKIIQIIESKNSARRQTQGRIE